MRSAPLVVLVVLLLVIPPLPAGADAAEPAPPQSVPGSPHSAVRIPHSDGRAPPQYWAEAPEAKVRRTDPVKDSTAVWNRTANAVTVSAAVNEYEPFQVVVRTDADDSFTIGLSDLIRQGGGGWISRTQASFHKVMYAGSAWPDPLFPIRDWKFSATGLENSALWVTLYVPSGTPQGIYTATLTLSGTTGTVSLPLSLTVWNFTLPYQPTLRTWYDEWADGYSDAYGLAFASPEHETLMRGVYQMYRAHRINPGKLVPSWPLRSEVSVDSEYNVTVDFTRSDAVMAYYLDTLGLQNFMFPLTGYFPRRVDREPGSGHPDEIYYWDFANTTANPNYTRMLFNYTKTVADHYRQRGWLQKAYLLVVDEPVAYARQVPFPWSHAPYRVVREYFNMSRAAAPDLRSLTTEDITPELYDYTDVWDTPGVFYQEADAGARRANGQETWWYNIDPGISAPGEVLRATYWDTFAKGLDGVEYWGMDYWGYDTVDGNPWNGSYSDGDGYLVYPGPYVGINDSVLPSIRLELAREGIEDYEYLSLLGTAWGTWAAQGVASSASEGSMFGLARSIDHARLRSLRDTVAGILSNPMSGILWNESFQNLSAVEVLSGVEKGPAIEGRLRLSPANPEVMLYSGDGIGDWRPNSQPGMNSSTFVSNFRNQGTGSLRFGFWRNDDPAILGGYGAYDCCMRNGRVISTALPDRDWSRYDYLEMDVYSETTTLNAVRLFIENGSGDMVVGDRIGRYSEDGQQPGKWHHLRFDISGVPRGDVQYIEPVVVNSDLEFPFWTYYFFFDNITLRRGGYRTAGTVQTGPVDLGYVAAFTALQWAADAIPSSGAAVTFETRTSSDWVRWEEWRPVVPDGPLGGRVLSTPQRFFEVRANLTSTGTGTPTLSELRLVYQAKTTVDLAVANGSFEVSPALPNDGEPVTVTFDVTNLAEPFTGVKYVNVSLRNATQTLQFRRINITSTGGLEVKWTGSFPAGRQNLTAEVETPAPLLELAPENNTANLSFRVNAFPRAAITAPPTATVGDTVFFRGGLSTDPDGDPLWYRWDFGDSTWNIGMNTSHVFQRSGTYTVTLTVNDTNGAANATAQDIAVYNRTYPADFLFSPRDGTVFTNFTFNATVPDPDSMVEEYRWDFGDGAAGTGPGAVHRFGDDRNFTVTLTVFYREGMGNSSLGRNVTVKNLPPKADFLAGKSVAPKGQIVAFDGSFSTDPDDSKADMRFMWDFGDGNTSEGEKVVHAFYISGNLTVTLTVLDDNNASSTATAVIRITNKLPVAAFYAPKNLTATLPSTFDAANSSDPDGYIANYTWDFGDGTYGYGKAAGHAYANEGNYTVRLTVTDDSGDSVSAEKKVAVAPKPVVKKTAPVDSGLRIDAWLIAVVVVAAAVGGVAGILFYRRRKRMQEPPPYKTILQEAGGPKT